MTRSIESVAILIDGNTLQSWQYRALSVLVSERSVSIDQIVINEYSGSRDGTLSISDFQPWNLYRAAHRRLTPDPTFRKRVSLDDVNFLNSAEIHHCQPIAADGIGNQLPPDAVEALRSVDIAVRFGFGILVGDALNAPSHGVLSYHHGDLTKYRGRPAGFWEFVHGRKSAGVTLQRLSETLDGGEIIAFESVQISDAKSLRDVRSRLFRASDGLLVRGIDLLEDPQSEPREPSALGDLYTTPGFLSLSKYAIRCVFRHIF